MIRDTITESIRATRHALAAKFDNDIKRIGDDLRRQQKESARTIVRLPKRRPRIVTATNTPSRRSG
jgi:hypothetical protein